MKAISGNPVKIEENQQSETKKELVTHRINLPKPREGGVNYVSIIIGQKG